MSLNTYVPAAHVGAHRLDGFVAGVPLTIRRSNLTLAQLAALGTIVGPTDVLEHAEFVMRDLPWSDDALAHVSATITRGTLSDPLDGFGCDVALDAATSALTRLPHSYALYLGFAAAGTVVLEGGTIMGAAVAAPYTSPLLTDEITASPTTLSLTLA